MRLRAVAWIMFFGSGVAAPASTLAAQQGTARRIAELFFSAAAAGRWKEAASYLDLDAFETYRRQQVRWSRVPQPVHELTAEELMRHDPDMPRAVADYQVAKYKSGRGEIGDGLSYEYAGISSADSLAALSTLDAAARWIQARDPIYQMELSIARYRREGSCQALPTMLKLPRPAPNRILGVTENDSLAYVVHDDRSVMLNPFEEAPRAGKATSARPTPERWMTFPPTVLQLRRVKGRWAIFGELRQGGVFAMSCETEVTSPSDSATRHVPKPG